MAFLLGMGCYRACLLPRRSQTSREDGDINGRHSMSWRHWLWGKVTNLAKEMGLFMAKLPKALANQFWEIMV